jgi:arsenite methyltransferase
MSEQDLKTTVRKAYGKIALDAVDSCCDSLCCAGASAEETSRRIGYTDNQIATVPEGANLGLGCGNPLALASVREGDVVLDLGSGAGFDCFLAAQRVGPAGRVIGVDMTPEMLTKARRNAEAGGYTNVEFRLGELEALPVADSSVDLAISNCVINLVPDRERVYLEALRVLRPGGRISVSDTIQTAELPEALLESEAAKAACLSAAVTKDDYIAAIEKAGFVNVRVEEETPYPADLAFEERLLEGLRDEQDIPEEAIRTAACSMMSIAVTGEKPG